MKSRLGGVPKRCVKGALHHRAWAILFLALMLCGVPENAGAAVNSWQAAADGLWSDSANWALGRVPDAGDDVVIGLTGTYTITIDTDVTFNTLLLSGSSSGTRSIDWVTGSITCVSITNQTNCVINITGEDLRTLTGTIVNQGHLNWDASGPVSINFNDGLVDNRPGGVFELKMDAYFAQDTGAAVFNNTGTFLKSGGTGISGFSPSFAVTNGGLFNIQLGTLEFHGGFSSTNTFNVATGAAIDLVEGTFNFGTGHGFTGVGFYGVQSGNHPVLLGTMANTNFQFSGGTLTLSNTITGVLYWSAGDLSGAPTVGTAGTIVITADDAKNFSGVLTNRGHVNWLSDGPPTMEFNNSRIENLSGSVFDLQTNAVLVISSGTSIFNNAGTLRKSGGDAIGGFSPTFVITNTGLVDSRSGILSFGGGFTSSGTFNVEANAFIDLAFGVFNFNPGHNFTGNGFYGVITGNPIINGPIANTNFQFQGGTLTMSNQITGVLQWQGGTLAGAVTVAANGAINFQGGGTISGVLTNYGKITGLSNWVSTVSLSNGRIENTSSGVFELQADGNITLNGGTAVFNNAGIIRKTGTSGAGSTIFRLLTMTNTGLIDVQSGLITLPSAYTQIGGQLNVGLSSPTVYGRIYYTGAAALTGTVSANSIGGYQPLEGASFDIINYFSTQSGSFSATNLFAPPVPLGWRLAYNSGAVNITTVDTSSPTGTKTWVNPGGGGWGVATNWNPVGVPGPGHDVVVNLNGSYTVNMSTGAVFQTLALGGGTGTQTIDWSAGPMIGAATVAGSGQLNISSTNVKTLSGTLTNLGKINWLSTGPTTLTVSNAQVQNLSGGVFEIQMGGQFQLSNGTTGSVNNAGTLRRTGTGTGVFGAGVPLTNTGTVDVQGGGLQFNEGFTSSSTFNVVSGSTISLVNGTFNFNSGHNFTGNGFYGVAGGTVTINGPIINTNFQFASGTLNYSNQISGVLQWNGGTLVGTPTVAASGIVNIGTATTRVLQGVLTNAGRVNWLSTGPSVLSFTDARVENLNGGLFDVQLNGVFSRLSGSAAFNNAGILRKSAGTNIAGFSAFFGVTNTGLVDVQSGALQFSEGFTSSSTFNVNSGASINLVNGTFNFTPGHNFTGSGYYGIPSGNPFINGAIASTNFQLTGGSLTMSNQISGGLQWTGGTLAGAPSVTAAGVINIGTTNAKTLTGVLTNAGTINWLNAGPTSLAVNGTLIQNQTGGLVDLQMDGTFAIGSGNPAFNNAGTLRKSGGAGTAAFANGFGLTNLNVIDVRSGTLQLPNTYTQTGGQLSVGLSSPSAYGRIAYGGPATLTGSLGATSIGGYQPTNGTVFNVITFSSSSGAFTSSNLFTLNSPLAWRIGYGATAATLTVVDPRPTIGIALSGGSFTVSWPQGTDPSFVLQSATNLTASTLWSNVTNSSVLLGGQYNVTVPTNGSRLFLRLISP